MRTFVLSVAVVVLAACGSSSKSTASPGPIAGTIGGRAFSPVDLAAIHAASTTPCQLPTDPLHPEFVTTVGVSALAVGLTSFHGACAEFAGGACTLHPNEQDALLLIAKVNFSPPYAAPDLGSGTFTVANNPAQLAPTSPLGVFQVAYAQAVGLDPVCAGTAHPSVAGGTITLDPVGAGSISGSVTLRFDDGSTLGGAFASPQCNFGGPVDVCALALEAISSGGGGGLAFCAPSGCAP